MTIGVLALQGDFAEHIKMLNMLGVKSYEIRKKDDLERDIDGIILPGGESTVMGKLLRELSMLEPLRQKIKSGLPAFGTCAGMILLAKKVSNNPDSHLATMDIKVLRNAYGRQLDSFHHNGRFDKLKDVSMTFIRAPYIEEVGKAVDVISEVKGKVVAAKQKNQLAISFHPEVTNDPRIHQYFLEMVNARKTN